MAHDTKWMPPMETTSDGHGVCIVPAIPSRMEDRERLVEMLAQSPDRTDRWAGELLRVMLVEIKQGFLRDRIISEKY